MVLPSSCAHISLVFIAGRNAWSPTLLCLAPWEAPGVHSVGSCFFPWEEKDLKNQSYFPLTLLLLNYISLFVFHFLCTFVGGIGTKQCFFQIVYLFLDLFFLTWPH